MTHEQIIAELLDRGWTRSDLLLAARVLDEMNTSESLRAVVDQIDGVRAALSEPKVDCEPAGGWEEFESRLEATLTKAQAQEYRPASTLYRLGWPVAWAAVLVLMAIGWTLYLTDRASKQARVNQAAATVAYHTEAPDPALVSFAKMTTEEMDQQTQVFDQVYKAFDKRTGWVAIAGDTANMGLTSGRLDNPGPPLLLRLVVLREGRVLSRSDLAIIPGQEVDLTLPMEDARSLRYRLGTSIGTPTRLSLWVEIKSPDGAGRTLAAMSTEVAAKPGDLIRAGQFTTSSGEYQVEVGLFRASHAGGV